MSSRQGRRPTSHRRRPDRAAGLPVRRLAIAAGALTVVAGVGTGMAMVNQGDDGAPVADVRTAADRAASSASPMAEDAASATASPKKTKRPSPRHTKTSAKPSPRHTEKKETRAAQKPEPSRTTRSAPRSAPVTKEASSAATGEAARILQLVNKERSSAGCSPVTSNSKLTDAAQKYTDVMARNGELSHTGPDGSSVSDRVEREGYSWSTVGENIAQGQQDAEAVMDAWMNSSGHKANILNCDFKELGIGIHQGDGGPWWTQDFATRR
ncbi:CAP domain-containing protein [Streptomyces sp. NPDC004647]|uniref:CAP domain-containing protein n=1 Tax=Streptomyces sp. NPDC004647 TaxID=3154671 RepID=UPI0033B6156F